MSEHLNKYFLGIDIGGSHISSVLVDMNTNEVLEETYCHQAVTSDGNRELILQQWKQGLEKSIKFLDNRANLCGVAVAVPGPFDYENGICLMQGVNKYNALFRLDIKKELQQLLQGKVPVLFENDAACFALGESLQFTNKEMQRIIAVTLGTGFGSAFIYNNIILKEGNLVPPNGELYNIPYQGGISEDYISSKWILNSYNIPGQQKVDSVYSIAKRAKHDNDETAIRIFSEFGKHLAACLQKWIYMFNAECLIIGGSIARSAELFLPALKEHLENNGSSITIKISEHMELSSIKGATALLKEDFIENSGQTTTWRQTSQSLMPQQLSSERPGDGYNLYPTFTIGDNKIFTGYATLAEWLITRKHVLIDGIVGNDWKGVQNHLSYYFKEKNISVTWYEVSEFMHADEKIETLIKPFVSQYGHVWGTRTTLKMGDFYDDSIKDFKPTNDIGLHILIGTGAALANWDDLIYLDIPKNEIQYRMRAGQKVSIANTAGLSNQEIYKRLYFVDWVVNDQHKQLIYDRINIVADCQWSHNISWAYADTIYEGLKNLSTIPIRVRPWFEAGAWGGQWLKQHINGLNKDEINYAWSFELIVPENGVVLESSGNVLEVAFKWLMDIAGKNILGKDYTTFGNEFPIRFDYLDTVEGGNLSIQCHPSLDYIQKEFGENITQDETYYILDCKSDARVYLGFQDDVNPDEFKIVLEESFNKNVPVTITDYVQSHAAKKHDFFLIPNKTIHSAGKNNLVLEISATPYIFTFKMYDWLRPDLDGNPRPINIEHAFKNLDFSRKGKKAVEELISKPVILKEDGDYTLIHLPTHKEHFYDVHRIEFTSKVDMQTGNKCFVMMLVEGISILIRTKENKHGVRFNYAETFIIPASVESFEIINETNEPIKIIKAFIK